MKHLNLFVFVVALSSAFAICGCGGEDVSNNYYGGCNTGAPCNTTYPKFSACFKGHYTETCACKPDVAPGSLPEVVNGVDDNCNGEVLPEECKLASDAVCTEKLPDTTPNSHECSDRNQTCTVGTGGCQRTGNKVCDSDVTSHCNVTPGTPGTEVCNGVDDDCDGSTDEGNVCNNNQCHPTAEVCNGVDDDCDGQIDEGNVCNTCTGCNNQCKPTAEVCNGVDDDCDGLIDEGNVCNNAGSPVAGLSVWSFQVNSAADGESQTWLRNKLAQFRQNRSNGFKQMATGSYSESYAGSTKGWVIALDSSGQCPDFRVTPGRNFWCVYWLTSTADTTDYVPPSNGGTFDFASSDRCPGVFVCVSEESVNVSRP